MRLEIEPKLCTGCRLCESFCALVHEEQIRPWLARVHVRRDESRAIFLPVACPACEAKPCIDACPEPGAISQTPLGAVVINELRCTGCSKCVRACEIGAIFFRRVPGRGKHGKAVALKCDLCGGDPWCVRVCAPGALRLVDGDGQGGQTVYERLKIEMERLDRAVPGRALPFTVRDR